MKELAGRVCVVTGAGSGIGQALSLKLAERGARLAVSDIDAEAVAATAAAAAGRGAEVEHYRLDVSNREAVFAHADQVTDRFGTVNLAVNNAGVAVSKTFLETPLEDFDWLLGINLWGVLYGIKAFLPKLIESGDGHLVNMSSVLGLIGFPNTAAYSAAKFAVRGLSESLRQELLIAHAPVKVSCVHPGAVKTSIAWSARIAGGDREEFAARFDKTARMTADRAAELIIRGIEREQPRIIVGRDARAIDLMQRSLGARYQVLMAGVLRRLGPSA